MATPRLNQDDDMIARLEADLTAKIGLSYESAGLDAAIHGVFSLDDLENKTEDDLCRKLAVGVGYAGAQPYADTKAPLNTAPGGNAAKMLAFVFTVVLAVPTGRDCTERHNATKLLTVLRRGILGSTIDGDSTNRTWAFVKEYPNINESTDSMLYYTQVWQVPLMSATA